MSFRLGKGGGGEGGGVRWWRVMCWEGGGKIVSKREKMWITTPSLFLCCSMPETLSMRRYREAWLWA